MAFGVLSLCSHLEVIESEVTLSHTACAREDRLSSEQGFTPNTVLFLATLFGHLIIFWDMVLAFGIRQPLRYWRTAGVIILIMDSTSVVVTAAEAGTMVNTWNDVGRRRLYADDKLTTEADTGIPDLTTNAGNSRRRRHSNVYGNGSAKYRGSFFEH